jgi:hypothetical protein
MSNSTHSKKHYQSLTHVFLVFLQNDSIKKEGGGVEVYEYTPENILAGITSSLGIFPVTGKMTSKDRIFLELNNNDGDVWGSEISVALAGLYSGQFAPFFPFFITHLLN